MWVLMSTDSMHSALLFSMNPMPPMSAARLVHLCGTVGDAYGS